MRRGRANLPYDMTSLETVLLGRFFGGVSASGPLAIVGGALSDFWEAEYRGGVLTCWLPWYGAAHSPLTLIAAIALFALATFGGPSGWTQ